MRIAICGHFLVHGGGKDRYSRNLINELSSYDDFDVFVIDSDSSEHAGTDIKLTPESDSTILNSAVAFARANHLDSYDLDLIHCPGEVVPPYFYRVNATKVVTFGGDGLFSDFDLRTKLCLYKEILSFNPIMSLLLLRLNRTRIDNFIVVSELMKENIKQSFGIKSPDIDVIHHGINVDKFQPPSTERLQTKLSEFGISKPYILHVSNYRKIKNTQRIVEAFESVVDENPEVSLVFAGPKRNEHQKVKSIVDQKEISNVNYLGYVDEGLNALYSGAEVLCQPSFRETFGFPIIESIACGTPVISSGSVGVLEDTTDAYIAVDPAKTEEIKDALARIIKNKRLQQNLLSNCGDLVEDHRWENVVKEYASLYRRVCE